MATVHTRWAVTRAGLLIGLVALLASLAATPQAEAQPASSIGLANYIDAVEDLGNGSWEIDYVYVIENLGSDTLTEIVLTNDFDATFAPATVVLGPAAVGGDCATEIAAFPGHTLAGGASCTATWQIVIEDVPAGSYPNTATVTARNPVGDEVSDISDFALNSDANGNGNANEPGENDPTPLTFALVTPDHSALLSSLAMPAASYVPTGGGVSQVVHSATHDLLLVRNSATQVRVIDPATGSVLDERFATNAFTDLSVTPDGNYFFAADWGQEDIGAAAPLRPHVIHRYDIAAGTWTQAAAPGRAWKIEAVSADRVLLQGQDQWVDITLNSFGVAMVELASVDGDFSGDFEFDPATGAIYKGNTGISSPGVYLRQLTGDTLSIIGDTGFDGAEGGGPTSVLTPNGSTFFYGRLQFATSDFSTIVHEYPSPVIGSGDDYVVLEDGTVWFIATQEPVGALGWQPKAVHGTSGSGDLWLVHPDNDRIFRCVEAGSGLTCPGGPATPNNPATPNLAGVLTPLQENGRAVPSGGAVSQMEGLGELLVVMDTSEVRIIDPTTGTEVISLAAMGEFADVSSTPDGEFVFALDRGQTDTVHRYERATATWTSAAVPSGNFNAPPRDLEAIDGSTVLMIDDGFGDITLNTYFPVGVMVQDATGTNSARGDLHLERESGLVLVSDRDSSANLIAVHRVDNQDPRPIVSHMTDSVPAFPNRSALSVGGEWFFHGRLQLEAIDPTNERHVYPTEIVGASTTLAWAEDGTVWDMETKQPTGSLGFSPSAVHALRDGSHGVYIAHPDEQRIFVCVDDPEAAFRCSVQEVARGDSNCDGQIDIIDALVIAQYSAAIRTDAVVCAPGPVGPNEIDLSVSEVNNDGVVDIIDALVLAQCDAGIFNVFCPAPLID